MKLETRYTLFVLAAYFFLTIVMTWPTLLHLTDAIPGDGFDGWQNYWNLWWIKQALLVDGTNPFFTHYLYPPTGVSLLFHTLNIFNGLWTLPLQLNLGLAPAYNGIVFVSFVLAGYGGYLLSLYTLSQLFPTIPGLRLPAFVGGLIFTMSPFHMAHLLGHMQVFSMIWPPFYVLWLLRSLEPWSAAGDRFPPHQWRNAAISALFLILASSVAWYHTLYLLIFTAVTLIWSLTRLIIRRYRGTLPKPRPLSATNNKLRWLVDHPLLRPIWVVAVIGLGFGLVMAPILLPMVQDASSRPDLETGLVQNITLSADLLAFITPSELHPLWGDWAKKVADNFSATTSERLIFAGFVPLALVAVALIWDWSSRIIRYWALIVAIFFVLALGPFLHVGGEIVTIGDRPLPLPYLLLYHTVPFIDLTRSLSRYDLMIMLGLGVLGASALVRIQLAIVTTRSKKDGSAGVRNESRLFPVRLVSLLAIGLICFEFLPIPYPISGIDTPQFYIDLGRNTEDFTIAELPMNWDRPTPLLHQTSHTKRLLTAYTSRDNPREVAWRIPVFQHWRQLGPDIIDQPLELIAPTIFFDFNLRYIVLDYWQMPPGFEREQTESLVAAALPGIAPVYEDERLKAYKSPPKVETQPYLSLGDGWGDRREQDDGQVVRRIPTGGEKRPEIFVHHPADHVLTLEVTAGTAGEAADQSLLVFLEGEALGDLEISTVVSTHRILLPPIDAPLARLSLQAGDPAAIISISRIGLDIE